MPEPKIETEKTELRASGKCESVRKLLNESMCEFIDSPHLLCVDRKCSECGVERVGRRLRECLGTNVGKEGWSKWEHVNE